jgi:hypothetical protein
LRVLLVTPALGAASMALMAFALSQMGLTMGAAAGALVVALTLMSVVVLAWRHPSVTTDGWPIVIACALGSS